MDKPNQDPLPLHIQTRPSWQHIQRDTQVTETTTDQQSEKWSRAAVAWKMTNDVTIGNDDNVYRVVVWCATSGSDGLLIQPQEGQAER